MPQDAHDRACRARLPAAALARHRSLLRRNGGSASAAAPDLEFLWLCNAGDAAKLPVARNATTVTLNSRAPGMAEQIEVPWTLRRHRVALLHAPVTFSVPLAAPRFVTTAHDLIYVRFPEFLPNPFARAYYNAMTRWSVARARHMITVSEATRADLIARWPQAALKTTTLLNGVSSNFARVPSDKESEHWRNALALPPHYVLYIGTRKQHKNLPRLLGSLRRFGARRACALSAGHGGAARPALSGSGRHDCAPRHRWRHSPSREPAGGRTANALPGRALRAPAVALRGLRAARGGRVCLRNTGAGRARQLPAGSGGSACVLVDPEDTASIRSGLSRLLNDADLYAQLKARTGFEARRFDWNDVARRVAQIYRDALA